MSATPPDSRPPVAKRVPFATRIHGDVLPDDYAWMRNKEDPDTIAYLEAENRYADAMMAPAKPFEDALYKEMLGRIKETDLSVPYPKRGYFYYSRTVEGLQYPIYCRKKGSLEAAEEITLDQNELAKGHAYFSIGAYSVSDDGTRLAYSTDDVGFRQYKLFVKDLRTGATVGPLAERVNQAFWAADNETLFYVTEDETTKRSDRMFRHRLGGAAVEIFAEPDELYRVVAGRTRSGRFVIAFAASSTTSEARFLPADKLESALRLIAPRREEHEYFPEHHGDRFFIRTNDKGRNFRLVEAPVSDPGEANWREVIAHDDAVMLEDVNCFARHMVISTTQEGLPRLAVTAISAAGTLGPAREIAFPEPVYSAYPHANEEFDTAKFRFGYESFITPRSVFEYDMDVGARTLLKQTDVLGGYDPTRYRSERLYATAKDGTRVPISVLYPAGLVRDGNAPLLLNAYGSYGAPSWVMFNSNRFSLIDRGMVFAQAHIRGGGDMGKIWHEQGRMMQKMNTFTDFIACAEHLVAEKWTRPEKLVITGGSAGGLLMGAVSNQRPDLFRAVVSIVPFVDVMNSMLDASLPLTVGEYLEWGNPNEKDAYFYMKSYSPYDNIAAKAYPIMLLRTSLSDSQVMYWEAAKYAAKLRAMKTDANLLLLKTNMQAGHGGASGRYDKLREAAGDYAFMLTQVGITA